MEQEYLIDTNVVIDYLDNKLPEANSGFIDGISAHISAITRMNYWLGQVPLQNRRRFWKSL